MDLSDGAEGEVFDHFVAEVGFVLDFVIWNLERACWRLEGSACEGTNVDEGSVVENSSPKFDCPLSCRLLFCFELENAVQIDSANN